jgi:hypothetical protein
MQDDSMKILRSIWRDPKQSASQTLVRRLALQLTSLYEDSVREALFQQKANLLHVHGMGQDLAVDLSPEGVDDLLNNLPPSIISILKAEETEVKRLALQLANTVEHYERGGREQWPILPAVRELIVKSLEAELKECK